jgi:hypothetical protein
MVGTCVRSTKGEILSAVAWVDGKEVWVQITIVDPSGSAKSITLPGGTGMLFVADMKTLIPNAELVGG